MKNSHIVLIFFLSICLVHDCYSQTEDSLKVFFIGNGHGESFKICFGPNLLLKTRIDGPFTYYFNIPKNKQWKDGSAINSIIVMRKGRFGFFYRDVFFQVLFSDKKRYLVIRQNFMLKNRIAVHYEWVDTEPGPTSLH
jgi:hypothetical protein